MRTVVFGLLRRSGVPWLLRETLQRGRTTILVYHDPSPEIMETHLHALGGRYNLVTLGEYIACRSDARRCRLPPKSLVITFDDGYAGNYTLRGIFESLHVRPTIFVCTGLIGSHRGFWFRHARDVERLKRLPNEARIADLASTGFFIHAERSVREALSYEEIASLAAVADIQSHTVTHPILPMCTDEESSVELSRSKVELEERFGFAVNALAYPNGDYSERELGLARAAGYTCALTVDGGSNTSTTDMFRLKRIAVDDRDSVDALIVKASGVWGLIKRLAGPPGHGYAPASTVITGRAEGQAGLPPAP